MTYFYIYVKNLFSPRFNPELEKKYLAYKPRNKTRWTFKIIHTPSLQLMLILLWQCPNLVMFLYDVYHRHSHFFELFLYLTIFLSSISFILCWVTSKCNINGRPALVNITDITPYKVTKSSIGLGTMSLSIAFSFWWYGVVLLDYVFLGIFFGVILRNIYLYLLKRDILVKKERTKLVLFGLNQKIYYDHITGDQLFIVKHFRNFWFFFITSVILLHSAYLNGLITFDFIFDGLLFVYFIVFNNVMLYGIWRRFIYRNANPILDQLMSTFDAIFSFMDVHEVEASGRKIIEKGSEAANRGFFSRMLDSARETLESLRPSSPGNEVGPNNSEENHRIIDLSNPRGDENSSNPSGETIMDGLRRAAEEESLRQSSTGSSVSSTSTASSEISESAAVLENQKVTAKEVVRLEKVYYKEGHDAFFSKMQIAAFGGNFTAAAIYGTLRDYWILLGSCTDSFASVNPWGPFSKEFCVQTQLDAGWPCGALNEYQKELLYAIREHSNSEEFIDRFLMLRDDNTIDIKATLEAMAEHGWVFANHEGEAPCIVSSSEHTSAFISASEAASEYIYYAVVEGGSYILSWVWGS